MTAQPADLTREALQYYLIENGCKVSQGDAVEFFRVNFAHRVNNFGKNPFTLSRLTLFPRYEKFNISESVFRTVAAL